MLRRQFLAAAPLALGALCLPQSGHAEELPAATGAKLPRWRGFNLLENFMHDSHGPYHEEDFAAIIDWGFDFVRLPLDYRIWIREGDWRRIDEQALKVVDQAVEWGDKHKIHVCLNFHRAPGYTVAKPSETASLWTDPEAGEVCAMHWHAFAKRYGGIPSNRLSFNLLNEPPALAAEVYYGTVKKLVEAIRAEDPTRLVIADGRNYGGEPTPELANLGIAQAARGYAPTEVSHYEASWMNDRRLTGANKPWWPHPRFHGLLFGPDHQDKTGPLTFTGPIEEGTVLRVKLDKVSREAQLSIKADGKEVFAKGFKPGPGEGDWKESKYMEEWKIYQATYDRDYRFTLPKANQLELLNAAGDWLSFSEIGFLPPGKTPAQEISMGAIPNWDAPPQRFEYAPSDPACPFKTQDCFDRDWLRKRIAQPWVDLQSRGIGVIVGECGAFNRAPHAVVLRWMEDMLGMWKELGIGWALWNFRGGFGIVDSGRRDVAYEDWRGHKLDREMLKLLQRN
ncbi:MAG TPA: cellulase family glycosylhydrolase [Chthoniobacteraceae bacterium]|jgi:hypothetical protein